MITVKAPGKLYIAGEYAVVEPGNPAIIIAVNQFIQVKATLDAKTNSAWSDQSPDYNLQWANHNHQVVFNHQNKRFSYVAAAIKTTEQYLADHKVPVQNYHLEITSQLDSQSGHKYGLGSSAAVTVAVVDAICQVAGKPVDRLTLFKLSAIAHLSVQGNGSLGDVAASVYQGWIAYQSFDRQWLLNQLKTQSIAAVIELDWPGLMIQPLTPPADLKILIGWTGTPASTASLVECVAAKKNAPSNFYQHFLNASHQCVNRLIRAFEEQNLETIKGQINVNRKLLNELGRNTGVQIETPQLTQLCQIVDYYGGAAKSSGAGGGDCGIAIIDQKSDSNQIITQWQQAHIHKLDLQISYRHQEESHDQPSLTSQK
ncbi:phosphomevalonate kinase [Nicoliella spurrieriana]|uniref:phosphomevalonate kinase n=1 Tax=Nicoliella spurrieriana TaxID=2925830 RepID=A0A976RS46_9LACO|nr:phosphomevalonate kinase [Nicoliella spurrieriana]UQS86616.1 phosphomevalonate kinase [Nicoliella spurrieriana]